MELENSFVECFPGMYRIKKNVHWRNRFHETRCTRTCVNRGKLEEKDAQGWSILGLTMLNNLKELYFFDLFLLNQNNGLVST